MKHDREVGFKVRTLSNLAKRRLDSIILKKHADTPTIMHGWVIDYLYDNQDHDVFQRDLERKFSIRRSTVTVILQLMEKNELIVRQSVDYDARLKKLQLTDKAIEMHKLISNDIVELENTLRKGISEKELDDFLATIDKMIENIK